MAKKIEVIPCLDMSEGRVVKGVKFGGLRDAGDAVHLAKEYYRSRADEVVFLDVSASTVGKRTMDQIVSEAAEGVGVPIVVGGGISSVEDAKRVLDLGASRISVNTSALARPDLVNELVEEFGSEAVVVSLDVKTNDEGAEAPRFEVTTHGGKRGTGIDAVDWARNVGLRGAGMIMLNSIAEDGVQSGYDLDLLRTVRAAVDNRIIASGGCWEDRRLRCGSTDRTGIFSAASVFHFGSVTVEEVKDNSGPSWLRRFRRYPLSLEPALGARLKRDSDGLICAVIQDSSSGRVLWLLCFVPVTSCG